MLGSIGRLPKDAFIGPSIRERLILGCLNPELGVASIAIFKRTIFPFGCKASVAAFLRVSLALWAVGNSLLKLSRSAYFDDFPSLSEKASAKRADMTFASHRCFPSLGGGQKSPIGSIVSDANDRV